MIVAANSFAGVTVGEIRWQFPFTFIEKICLKVLLLTLSHLYLERQNYAIVRPT